MATWKQVEDEAPAFAARVRERFAVGKHCTLATLRADGSPRISGSEVEWTDGELVIGSMPGARKANDLLRDPRLAVHSPTVDPPEGRPSEWPGEAKVAGTAVVAPSPDESHRFHVDITEVVLTHLDEPGELLVVEFWHPGRGVEEIRRR
jgi:hypothetical protein